MRFLQKGDDGRLVFRLERVEREVFELVLSKFPVQQGALRPIGKGGKRGAQKLLEKALQEGRKKLRADLDGLLKAGGEIVIDADFKEFWDLRVTPEEVEWLLQALNDVRVGLWTRLGCPQGPHSELESPEDTSEERLQWAAMMQWCGGFQQALMNEDQD